MPIMDYVLSCLFPCRSCFNDDCHCGKKLGESGPVTTIQEPTSTAHTIGNRVKDTVERITQTNGDTEGSSIVHNIGQEVKDTVERITQTNGDTEGSSIVHNIGEEVKDTVERITQSNGDGDGPLAAHNIGDTVKDILSRITQRQEGDADSGHPIKLPDAIPVDTSSEGKLQRLENAIWNYHNAVSTKTTELVNSVGDAMKVANAFHELTTLENGLRTDLTDLGFSGVEEIMEQVDVAEKTIHGQAIQSVLQQQMFSA